MPLRQPRLGSSICAPATSFDPARVCIGQSHGHREYWLTEALVNRLIGSPAAGDQLKRLLDAKGLLASPSHRHSTRRNFRGERIQLLAIRADAFDAFLAASQSGFAPSAMIKLPLPTAPRED